MPAPQVPNPANNLNWLFVDLNSYFASVEQQVRPQLRNRPIGVVPMLADTTVCIAASYEAKAYGVKTGTVVSDARRMCPGIEFVEARHEIYVDYHHRIVETVETCLPVTSIQSIDEMACRLIGRERSLLAALELGRLVKARIRERVGQCLRSSVGLATNRYLAKVASDMEKPDGLVALPLDILPTALPLLELRDLPGIGARTEKRLNAKGIHTMTQLLALSSEQAGELWGSVWGERLFHWLRGEDFDLTETEHLKSISHSHVLAPELRTTEKAWAVAHKLLHKAAMRLRSNGLWASSISLSIGFAVPRSEKAPVSRFGVPTNGWHRELRLSECQDNPTLIAALTKLWNQSPAGSSGTGVPHPLQSKGWDEESAFRDANSPRNLGAPGLDSETREGSNPNRVPHPKREGEAERLGWVEESASRAFEDSQYSSASDERASAAPQVPSAARSADYAHPYFIGVSLNNLVPDRLHSLNLFDTLDNSQRRTRLMQAMDAMNQKYGTTALAPAAMLAAYKAAPTRIAFHSIPDLF
ncbi:MAG TPA: hypothetical protein VG844_09275 [Terracidiphilus sp.]|nr:hypothetical protein [Terracidiphilus sp.]